MASLKDQLNRKLKQLQQDIQESLNIDVGGLIVDKQQEHIITDVRNVYSPKVYKNRENGGLGDADNIVVSQHGECGIVVENITKPNMEYETGLDENDSLSDLIEFGDGYDGMEYNFKNGGAYLQPRPFQQNTLEELKESGEHVEVLKKSLKNKGYKFK